MCDCRVPPNVDHGGTESPAENLRTLRGLSTEH